MAKSGTILLVDDSPDDALLIRLAFKRIGLTNPLMVVGDGEKAVQYLTGEEPYSDRSAFPMPGLVLLDLAMPRMGGFDFLIWIGKKPELRSIPVVVLTGSALMADAKRSYQLGASSFVTKPADLAELALSLKQTTDFWLNRPNGDIPRGAERNPASGPLVESAPSPAVGVLIPSAPGRLAA
jgi:CheY-like chemotaxis protein